MRQQQVAFVFLFVGLLCNAHALPAGPPNAGVNTPAHPQATAVTKAGRIIEMAARPAVEAVVGDMPVQQLGSSCACVNATYISTPTDTLWWWPCGPQTIVNEVHPCGGANICCMRFWVANDGSEAGNVTVRLRNGGVSGTVFYDSGPIGPLDPGYFWNIAIDFQPDVLPNPDIIGFELEFDTDGMGPALAEDGADIGYCPNWFRWVNQNANYWFNNGGYDGCPGAVFRLELYTTEEPWVGACCVGDTCSDLIPYWDCENAGGTWICGQDCSTATCPPPNDKCTSVTPVPIPVPGSVTFNGDNSGATRDDIYLNWPAVWFAFTIDTAADVKIDLCGTDPPFGVASIVYKTDCGCSGRPYMSTNDWFCPDGNFEGYIFCLEAGTYYYPVYSEPPCAHPYTLTITTTPVAPEPACPENSIFSQPAPSRCPPIWDAMTSGATSGGALKVYDNFWGVEKEIRHVEWWGCVLSWAGEWWAQCEDPGALTWTIEFYDGVWTAQDSGSCCVAHEPMGCSDAVCEESVCSYDPYCCDVWWDPQCAAEAAADPNCDCYYEAPIGNLVCSYAPTVKVTETDYFYFGIWKFYRFEADLSPGCSLRDGVMAIQSTAPPPPPPPSGDCCVGHGAPGCEDPVCQASVCEYDPWCCEGEWDDVCAGEAAADPDCDCSQECLFLWLLGEPGDYLALQDQGGTLVPVLDLASCLCTFPRGDLNCDGTIDFGDINPFVLYLADFAAWQATYADCPEDIGDINGDGTYPDFGDINPFVALLSGGG